MPDLVGTVLDGAYRVTRLIGRGGMGSVYVARDLSLDPAFRQRFLQEARAIAGLEHPGIVQVHAFSRNPDLLYIVMTFVPGRSLRIWLTEFQRQGLVVSLPEALAIVETVCQALDYAHGQGVFHRDLKPGNILLKPLSSGQELPCGLSFQPVLADFGLAKLAHGGIHSMPGLSMGTPAYMAPEQCAGEPVDGRADIYALGVTLYEMVTGRVPFPVSTLTQALRAHASQVPPPPRQLMPDLPTAAEGIMLRALAKRPSERYQKAREIGQAAAKLRQQILAGRYLAEAARGPGRTSLVTLVPQAKPAASPEEAALPTPTTDGAQTWVIVYDPSGATRTVPLEAGICLTLGRDMDNDVVLAGASVSRHHAQLSFDGRLATLTDLSSTNGTFLEEDRLLPSVPERWTFGKRVRIGPYWLALEQGASTPVPSPPVSAGAATPSRGPGVEATLEPAQIVISPGECAEMTARVLNRQRIVDHFGIGVTGLPGPWVQLPDTELMLAPGDEGTITFTLQPPLAPSSQAGQHTFTVRVMSRAAPSAVAEVVACLMVAPIHRLAMSLHPSVYTRPGAGRLSIENQGNVTEEISLSATDPADALEIALERSYISLPAGQSQQQRVYVRGQLLPGQPPVIFPFCIHAQAQSGTTADVTGTIQLMPPPSQPTPPPPEPTPPPPQPRPQAPRPKPPPPKKQPKRKKVSAKPSAPAPEKKGGCRRFARIVWAILTLTAALFLVVGAAYNTFSVAQDWEPLNIGAFLIGLVGIVGATKLFKRASPAWAILFWIASALFLLGTS